MIEAIKGDAMSLDYGSCGFFIAVVNGLGLRRVGPRWQVLVIHRER